jgi:hypothetical protein
LAVDLEVVGEFTLCNLKSKLCYGLFYHNFCSLSISRGVFIMEKLFEKYCKNYGFIKDNELEWFKSIFSSKKIKEISIDIRKDDVILLLRSVSDNVKIITKDGCVKIYYNDEFDTQITNIVLDDIQSCIIKQYNESVIDIMLLIHNLVYSITVFI